MSRLQPANPDFETVVRRSFAAQGMMPFMGAELTVIEPGFCEIQLAHKPELCQQHGFFHAGVQTALVDSAGGFAALSLFGADDGVLTVEFKINLTAPADGERLIATGQVIKPGRTLTVCTGEVRVLKDGEEKVCAVMQQTMMRITGRADVKG